MALHKIRIRQADSTSQALMAVTYAKSKDGTPDKVIAQQYLNVPNDLSELYVGEDQYVVVKLREN